MGAKRWTYNRIIELLKNTGFSMVWTEKEFNDNKKHCRCPHHGLRILIKCACGCSVLRNMSGIRRSIKRENYYCGNRGRNYCNNINGQTYNEDETKKYCLSCKNMLLLNKFYYESPKKQYSSRCIQCLNRKEKEYREENIRNRLEYILKNSISSTRLRNNKGREHEFDIDLEYLLELWERCNGICFRFKKKMSLLDNEPWLVSVDRIDSDIGYVKGNVQLVCFIYNRMKMDSTEEEMDKVFEHLKQVYSNTSSN